MNRGEHYHIISPFNGNNLVQHSNHLMTDGENLFPVFDNIIYMRDRDEIRLPAIQMIFRDQYDKALRHLLRDQESNSTRVPPTASDLGEVEIPGNLSMGKMMQLLNYGPAAHEYHHLWSLPCFMAGLSLMMLTVQEDRPVLDMACHTGHNLRHLESHGFDTMGVDVVFSRLYLARHWMEVKAPLVCADVQRSIPIEFFEANTVLFLNELEHLRHQERTLRGLRTLATSLGSLAVSTDECPPMQIVSPDVQVDYDRALQLSPDGHIYTEDMLLQMWFTRMERPSLQQAPENGDTAIAWIEGQMNHSLYPLGKPAGTLTVNPLLSPGARVPDFPNSSFQKKYEKKLTYMTQAMGEHLDQTSQYRHRVLLDIPERW